MMRCTLSNRDLLTGESLLYFFKVKYFFLISILITTNSFTQNLVKNPSFEDTISCPMYLGQISKAIPWFNATDNTPDYFNSCWEENGNSSVDVPSNFWGFQYARTGVAYAGFSPYYGCPECRDYIEGIMLDSLIAGKKYCVEFYVHYPIYQNFMLIESGPIFQIALLVIIIQLNI